MRKVKISLGIIYWFIILALIVVAASTALSVFKIPGGISLFTVQSGSMEPTINTGSVVLVQKQDIYKKGDIITFFGKNKNETTTHRILATKNTNGEKIFATKGDANRGADREIIKENQILGKMVFFIPYLGYTVSFTKTQAGFIFLIIVPAVIIIFSEILNIKKEILKIIEKRKISGEPTKILTLLLLIGAILMLSTSTKAYLLDKENSDNNVLQAGIWGTPQPSATPTVTPTLTPILTPTPTPANTADHLVISEVQIHGGTANEDFVEIYNPTDSAIPMSGWQLRRKSSNGNDYSLVLITNGTIPAHGFFLWSNDQGDFETEIGADVSNSNNLSENNSVLLEDPSDNPVDQVAWGNGTNQYVEGTAFPNSPATSQSIERKAYTTSTQSTMEGGTDATKGNGFDTDNNFTDFVLRTLSQPQNSGSLTETP